MAATVVRWTSWVGNQSFTPARRETPASAGEASAVISVSGVPGTDYWPYLREVDALLGDFGARVHWGKLHFLTRAQLADRYPESERFIAIRRELDPQGLFLNDHLRELFA